MFKKGYKPTEKHLINLSLSHKGQKAWNKGLTMNDEFKIKCRNRQIGKFNRTEAGKISFSKKMSGENHPRWKKDRTQIDLNKRRNYTSKCIEWRNKVFERDNYKCKICNINGRLEAHHILSWIDYPELRYDINNGITLCHAHHPRKRAEEKRLVPIFKELVSVSMWLS